MDLTLFFTYLWRSVQNAYNIFTSLISGQLLTLFFSVFIFILCFRFLILPAFQNVGSDVSRKVNKHDN